MTRALAMLLIALPLASCRTEEKIVNYKPFFAGLDGVQTQTPATARESRPMEVIDVSQLSLIAENPDGTKRLILKSPQNLMWHISRTLADGAEELFVEQVLSELTRSEYLSRGIDPAESFRTLKKDEKAIAKLFARMPMGQNTPNVIMRKVGDNVFRLKLTGHATRGLEKWTGFDTVLEGGDWKLRWFY